jgi:hypothetical protein
VKEGDKAMQVRLFTLTLSYTLFVAAHRNASNTIYTHTLCSIVFDSGG